MLPSSLPPPTTTMQENIKKGEVMWPKLAANKILRWPLGSTNFVADSLPPPTTTMQENIKKGEVMWPKLIANKILRRPLGRTNFVADIPNSEIRLEETSSDNLVTPQKNHDNKMETHNYKLFATTWNIAGNSPSDDLNLEDWLDTRNNSYDIYVLGFQEIVPLSAKNVLGPEQRKISIKWNSLISSTLNESVCNLEGEPKEGGEKKNVYTVKDINTSRQLGYQCIISKQMVGIYISVWVRGSLLRFVRQPSVSCVGCGIMGCLGNKLNFVSMIGTSKETYHLILVALAGETC